jgi:hypothetical protein
MDRQIPYEYISEAVPIGVTAAIKVKTAIAVASEANEGIIWFALQNKAIRAVKFCKENR